MNSPRPAVTSLPAYHAGDSHKVYARRRFVVTLEAGCRFEAVDLRRLLKRLGRDHGLACISAVEAETPPAEGPAEGGGGGR